jgi:hypothetical protein
VFFFDEAIPHKDSHVADDGTAMQAPLISNRLVAGEALVGLAVPVGEEGSIGCPDRTGQNGHVPVGDFLKLNPVIFCFAGFGFGGFAVGPGSLHGFFTFHSPTACGTLGSLALSLSVDTLVGFECPGAFLAANLSELQGNAISNPIILSNTRNPDYAVPHGILKNSVKKFHIFVAGWKKILAAFLCDGYITLSVYLRNS